MRLAKRASRREERARRTRHGPGECPPGRPDQPSTGQRNKPDNPALTGRGATPRTTRARLTAMLVTYVLNVIAALLPMLIALTVLLLYG